MLLCNESLNDLHLLLKSHGINIDNRTELNEVGIKIAKFVLARELQKNV